MGQRRGLLPAVARIFIIGFWLAGIAILAFVWSLGQTIDFMSLGFSRPFDLIAGLVIQFGPQVFLYMASRVNESEPGFLNVPKRFWFMFGFFGFSTLDAFTNIGARYEYYQTLGQGFQPVHLFWYTIDVLIVFAEEVMLYGISAMSDAIADAIESVDGEPPSWLRSMGDMAHRAAVGTPGNNSRRSNNSSEGNDVSRMFRS